MKKNRLLGLALIPTMVIGALSFSSCGSKKNNFAYDIDFTADISGVTIDFWTGFGTDINDVLTDVISEFESMTGVRVNYESKGSYDGVLQATNLSATQVAYPHLVVGYPDHFATYVTKDIIVRLDYYFENDVPAAFEGDETFEISDFYEDYMRENQSIDFDRDGNPYTLGVPFNKSTEVMIYNKTFFDWCAAQNDLKDSIYVPATYEQLDSVGTAILNLFKTKGVYNSVLLSDGTVHKEVPTGRTKDVVIDLTGVFEWGTTTDTTKSFKPFSYDSQANLFITTVRQNGGTYTYYDKADKHGYIDFNSQETINGLNTLKALYDKNIFGIPADWDEAKYGSNPFKANKTVMTLGSSAGVANSAPTGNKFEIAAAPTLYHEGDSKYVISQGANLALLDTGTREQRLAAWTLLKFLTKYANGYICASTGYFPSCPYAENGNLWVGGNVEEYVDYATWIEDSQNPLASMSEKVRAQTANVNIDHYIKDSENWTKFVDQPFPGSADIRTQVAAIPGWVFYNTYNPQAAINKMYEILSDYVKK